MSGWAQILTAIAAVIAAVGSYVNGRRVQSARGEIQSAHQEIQTVHDDVQTVHQDAKAAHERIEQAVEAITNGNGNGTPH